MRYLKYFEMRSMKGPLMDRKKAIVKQVIDWKFMQDISDLLVKFEDEGYVVKMYVSYTIVKQITNIKSNYTLYMDDEYQDAVDYWADLAFIPIDELRDLKKEEMYYIIYAYKDRTIQSDKNLYNKLYNQISHKCNRISSKIGLVVKAKYEPTQDETY